MRPVSTRFRATVRESHQVAAEVELYFPLVEPSVPVDVAVEQGHMTIDRNAQVRRTASLRIPWSLTAGEELGLDVRTLPFGGHARLRTGIRFPDGTVELVILSEWMRVESVTWGTLDQTATIELADRMVAVRDFPFLVPFDCSGMPVGQAAYNIVHEVFGDTITYRILYNPPTPLNGVILSGSRVDALAQLARSVGGDAYFDADGAFVFDVAAGGVQIATTGDIYGQNRPDPIPHPTGWQVIENIPDTSQIVVGMSVTGIGIPVSGRRVIEILDAHSVRLNARAHPAARKNSRLTPGSPIVTEITDTDDLSYGLVASGPGIQAGSIVTEIRPAEVTLSLPAVSTPDLYPIVHYDAPPNPADLLFAGGMAQPPVEFIDTGDAGVMVDTNESIDRSQTFNGVYITGQATPVSAAFSMLVTDDDPDSPTYWGGPFGKVVRIENTSAIQSSEQGFYSGTALLNDSLGLTRPLAIRAAPNPALEAGDVIQVDFDDGRSERHLIDTVTHDLGPSDSLAITTRSTFTPVALDLMLPLPTRRRVLHGAAVWRELRDPDLRIVA